MGVFDCMNIKYYEGTNDFANFPLAYSTGNVTMLRNQPGKYLLSKEQNMIPFYRIISSPEGNNIVA